MKPDTISRRLRIISLVLRIECCLGTAVKEDNKDTKSTIVPVSISSIGINSKYPDANNKSMNASAYSHSLILVVERSFNRSEAATNSIPKDVT